MRFGHRVPLTSLFAFVTLAYGSTAHAQPTGWSYGTGVTVQENSGADLTNYQVVLTLDTATLVGAGQMNADGSDLRVSSDCGGTTLLPYWIQSGTMNTASTKVWVRVPSILANGSVILYLGYGNAAATAVSSAFDVFDGDPNNSNLPYSSTDQVASGGAGGVGNSQRGFRFAPNQDVVAVQFGKREPTGTTRYVTLFDNSTQGVVAQMQVSGPAGQYSYANLADAVLLSAGQQYLLELYQDAGDGYYFGTSSQINAHLTYYDMRYCNSCAQSTFPTNVLSNYQYGYPDFAFLTRQVVANEPTTSTADCSSVAACTPTCARNVCGDGFVGNGEQCDDGNNDDTDACTNACQNATCGDGIVHAGVEQCDDANNTDTDACRNNCMNNVCGDGVVNTGVEACDDGNNVDTDACRNNCAAATCGDGVVQAGVEQCDDMNNVDTDGCTNTCMNAHCGDGIVETGVEQCDDGNANNNDGCTTLCKPPACGDGLVETGETCDDGNTKAGDGCSATCQKETVADGGAGDGGGNDAGAKDAGVPNVPSDGGAAGDAGPDPTAGGSGCSCDTTGQSSSTGAGLLALGVGLALVGSRRRRTKR